VSASTTQAGPAPGGDRGRGAVPGPRRPRVGFLGVGWIGRDRLDALGATDVVEVVAIADADAPRGREVAADWPGAVAVPGLDELLELDLDGMVIATPSALHAEQAVAALQRGVAVFCQKPLGRTEEETRRVVAAARTADRLLAVDLSYRHTRAVRAAADVVASGELGAIHAVDLVFHNAYGPDKPWFTQRELAGGGCLMDLGTHLIDLALWLTASSSAAVVSARLRHRGRALAPGSGEVEDFALLQLELDDDVAARVACSWFLPAGRECRFECTLYGTQGGVSVTNVDGSFYDFRADRLDGTTARALVEPPDAWGGRAIAAWGARLAADRGFDPGAEELVRLARVIDHAYGAQP
jgi:predicted dehydrogenase